jgi:hypothetical protein
MRKKAEAKIRQAAARLGAKHRYRIDQVRDLTDLIPKVYDKTILDMAVMNTIALYDGSTDDMTPAEIRKLIYYVDKRYVYFSFVEPEDDQEK